MELKIDATSAACAYFRYITSTESSEVTSESRDLRVLIIFLVIKSFAETITEFEGENGIAINLLIVGLFWAFNLSKILTASVEDKLSSLKIVIFAELFLSKSSNKSWILLTLLLLSTNNIEFIEGMLERCDCLPVIGFTIGKTSSVDLLMSGITAVSKLPDELEPILASLVASFSGTTLTKPLSEIILNPFTWIVLRYTSQTWSLSRFAFEYMVIFPLTLGSRIIVFLENWAMSWVTFFMSTSS